jgi:hypothetical protein
MGTSKRLTPQQVAAIEALLTQPTIKAASKASGVSYATLRRWLHEDAFVGILRRAQAEAMAQSVRGLVALSGAALERLRKLINSKDSKVALGAVRLALAQAVAYQNDNRKSEDHDTIPPELFDEAVGIFVRYVQDPDTRAQVAEELRSLARRENYERDWQESDHADD